MADTRMTDDPPVPRRGMPPSRGPVQNVDRDPREVQDPSNQPQTNSLPQGANLAKPVERDLNPQERLEQLLYQMRENARHNAPISPGHIRELEAIVAAGRNGKVPLRAGGRHVFPGGRYHDNQSIVIKDKDSNEVKILGTAEDALAYIRSLPDEVRNRPKWIVAERSLLDALDSNEPRAYQAAYTAITEAQGDDELVDDPGHDDIEKLPDGRIREDRFPDRRLPPKPEPETADEDRKVDA